MVCRLFARGVFLVTLGNAVSLSVAAVDPAAAAWSAFQSRSAHTLLEAHRLPLVVPPLPGGVEELSFKDFFEPVVGDRGLNYTDRLRALGGKRVRIIGHMVREPVRSRGVFLLTPWPVRVENDGYCITETLPPATLHVVMPGVEGSRPTPYVPGPLILSGVLEVGIVQTADGRNSAVRLLLDPPVTQTADAASGPSSLRSSLN